MFGMNSGGDSSAASPSGTTYGGGPMPGSPSPEPPADKPDLPLMPTMPVDSSSDKPAAPPLIDNQASDELIEIKKQALQSLTPLVSHLDQTPEEKFKTIMMMLQASDNPALVQDAYAAANAITDEKARAQALLDVVNEINYFTHKNEAQE